ncbi:hypothetical protein [Arsenophonus endosymbiont of Aleurodicus floccissimus]|uniref:hypothetical protein n=1 Tax=Arsenophonus endosymbiont of Aleurodicus floccissimus TaxID=2152761 RepID=UPI0016001456
MYGLLVGILGGASRYRVKNINCLRIMGKLSTGYVTLSTHRLVSQFQAAILDILKPDYDGKGGYRGK